ncbi:MAG: ATP-binding protein, partial [Roseiflexaceae bacterium]|nr:ATP-binding protein [Roseiflexaceae bacterium]
MSSISHNNWHTANQRYLTAALGVVCAALQRYAALDKGPATERDVPLAQRVLLRMLAGGMPDPPALDVVCAAFGLSPFERDILLLCAGVALDVEFARACALAQGEPQRDYPTFALALAALPKPNWQALAPNAPLRYWHLIDIGPGTSLTSSPLRIDERILHELTGFGQLDPQLSALVEPLDQQPGSHGHQELAEQIVSLWATNASPTPVIHLLGSDRASRRAVATSACRAAGLRLYALAANDIPTNAVERERLARLWEREAALSNSALLIECDQLDGTEQSREQSLDRLLGMISGLVLIAGGVRRRSIRRTIIAFNLPTATTQEQQAIWRSTLGDSAIHLNGSLDLLATQFSLSPAAIHTICHATVGATTRAIGGTRPASDELAHRLWQAARNEARQYMDDLAQWIEPSASWHDLILPEAQKRTMKEIVLHMRQRARVYQQWGFATKSARGLGISALFAGGSGTGKTMAAEVL